MRSALIAVAIAGLLVARPPESQAWQNVDQFEDPSMSVVFSATDEDAQIIILGGSDEGIRKVNIFAPDGSLVARFRSRDFDDLGYADFQFDTPEPTLEDLQAAYPEGVYAFVGRTAAGNRLFSKVELSYDLLEAPEIIFPMEGDEDIPVNGLEVRWQEIDDAVLIRLEVEDEEEEVALKVDLPGDAVSFEIPDNWLQFGVEYTLDIKAIGENGNQTVSDLRFTTVTAP